MSRASRLLVVLCLLPSSGLADSGTSAFAFLNLPTGARATAMGQAFTSVPNDVQGIAYNPASLATLTASQASFQHLSYISDVTEEGIAFGHAGREKLSWGILANYLHVGGIDRTVATLQPTGDGFTDNGQFSTYDMMLGATLAAPVLLDGLSVGTNIKFLRESLADAASNGAVVDVGGIYQSNMARSWNLGVALQNVGLASKFADAAVQLPWTFRAGASAQPFAQWLFSTDFVKRRDTSGEFDVGAELTPKKFFSLRVGYRYALTNPDLGGVANLSAGVGFRWNAMSLDYAFIPLGDLGVTQRVTLNARFKTHRD